jgi:hypothetical protein
MTRPWFRFMPLLGVLFVLLIVIGFAVGGDTPDSDSLPLKIRSDYDNEAKHQIAAYLVSLGAASLVFFAAHVRAVLRALDPGGRLGNAAFGGAVVSAAGFLVASLIHSALAEAAQKASVGGPALQALNALDNWSFYPFAVGLAVFVLASGAALAGAGRLVPAWLGWVGVVLGIAMLIPFVGFFAALLAAIWVIVVSLMLFARSEIAERMIGEGRAAAPATTIA